MLFNPDFTPLATANVFNDETKGLASWDPRFARLHCWASEMVRTPSAVMTTSEELDVLCQHVGPHMPTVVVYTPRCLARHAVTLACTEPSVLTETSSDLRSSQTLFQWKVGPYALVLPEHVLFHAINSQYRYEPAMTLPDGEELPGTFHEGFIAFVFVTPERTAIQLLKVDEDLIGALQGAGISSGCNFKPWREFSEAELAEAAHNGPGYFNTLYDYDGLVRLELAVHKYRLGTP